MRFINKKAQELSLYTQDELKQSKINILMPQIIAENHHKFVKHFMETGKSSIISKPKPLLMKQKDGHIVHIKAQVLLNSNNFTQLSITFFPYEDHKPFETEDDVLRKQEYGILTIDQNLKVMEISQSCYHICGLNQKTFRKIVEDSINFIYLQDLFHFEGDSFFFQNEFLNGKLFEKVTRKYDDQIQDDNDEEDFKILKKHQSSNLKLQIQVQLLQSANLSTYNDMDSSELNFSLICEVESLLDGEVKFPIVYIKRNQNNEMRSRQIEREKLL
ncbi:UNKNOWN [Stylonychia lemnae]|uniref:PAS domain-containing protein n=1 Tax=Stylonychia lemnae TaxID=5949 RepID=A0A078B714_STYLE|nr:UNKNOWN [Stylonychia lemnae]|eukprot:CDW90179.1 UNKNOWN [Stylonychia lemnae]